MMKIEITHENGEIGFRTHLPQRTPPASTLNRPVLGLVPEYADADTLTLGGQTDAMIWRSTFRPEAEGWWVETTLDVHQPVSFDPSMVLWIAALDHLDDRQAHTWRQTILRGPTTNQQGLSGNDLPACYLYDHGQQLETICFYPPESFAWASQRFYDFAAREIHQYRPIARFGVGLLANAPQTHFDFQPGHYQLRWWFTQRERKTVPSTWEAQQSLIRTITPLLDPLPRLPETPVHWGDIAEKTLTDLYDEACWTQAEGVPGLRAYVRGSSAVARDEAPGFELMTQLDVLWPLMLWRDATQNRQADALIERIIATLPHFDRPEHHFVANSFPKRAGDTFMDTWYFLENALIKLGWVAYLADDTQLKGMFRSAMQGGKALFENTRGQFPLFADATDWQARHSMLNVSVGGMYAAGCVIASQLFADSAYLDDAEAALTLIHQLPPHMLTHEPQQLTFAATAAHYLAQQGRGEKWHSIAADFVNLSLRMGYWGEDPAVPFYDPRGMFQACASLGYPAFKENVEVIFGWSELLNDANATMPTALMSAFANLQRVHNASFFDPWLPESMRRGPCPYIPYEDLATAEFPHTAKLGKEIYGAGEVFWSALLFGPVTTDTPDVLVMALDIPCLELRRVPQENRRILLYNPQPVSRKITLRGASTTRTVEIASQSIQVLEGI